VSLVARVVERVRRKVRREALGVLYARGQRRGSLVEAAEPSIIRLGERLRLAALDENRGRFSGTPWRFLLCTPPSIAAEVWFGDLETGMRHAGVPVRRLPPFASVDASLLDEVRPNVVVALDQEAALARVDLVALREYKRAHGCLRLFVPTRDDIFAPGEMSKAESRRLQRDVDGDGADACLSLYEPECFLRTHRAWADAGFRCISVPQSGNPIEDFPRDVPRVHDYFFASVCTPERLRTTWSELAPILWRHRGDWSGEGWGFGGRVVPFADIPARYGAARIALAPLLPALRRQPFELTHRVFEAASCGAFQISSLTPITRRFFSEGALVCARDGDDFARLFEQFVNRPDERNGIAERALVELYAAHTVFHRIEALLAELDSLAARV
jgi:Glycosyl transferases group 1